ncbi:MAG TPA: OB-fold domain-containing protein [Myxococcota bacterium]|nr:OB-fold domain-containing protein [Myxococcota bacterium]
MSGITRYGSYVPYYRLSRSALGAGRGERAAASYDEDSVSMAVEASRDAIDAGIPIDALIFATTSPPYAEKSNAATVHAALSLPDGIASLEVGATSRAGLSALLVGLDLAAAGRRTLVAAADVVIGAPGGTRESSSGDAAVSFACAPDDEAIAVLRGRASATTELLDVWRLPEDAFASQWEERFGAEVLAPVLQEVVIGALKDAGVNPSELATVILDATLPRAAAGLPRALQLKPEQLADPLATSVGRSGVAQAGLLLARALDRANPGDRILVASLADGCDAAVFEVTSRIARGRPRHSVDAWIASKRNDLAYNTYLKWRGILPFEPPRRPEPQRPAAPPMHRSEDWKLGFVGSRCTACGAGQLPPQRVCSSCGAVDQMADQPFANRPCRIATYTLDHLAYSLQPPTVAAVLDYEGGGRLACELTDVEPTKVAIGDELEMTFRRLYTGQGVHNYFWKARPRR